MPYNTAGGTKVILAFPENGGYSNMKLLEKLGMKKGDVFTVDCTDLDGFSTILYLQEFPGEMFKTINFSVI